MKNFLFDLLIGKSPEAHSVIIFGRNGHDFKCDGAVFHSSKVITFSASLQTATRYKCRCGMTYFVLTPAGQQQLFAGDNYYELIGATA
jgi:hypothetical protein